MLGRRGPVQASFTPPELKELGELAGADVVVDPADLELDPASERELADDPQRAQRNLELLREYAARPPAGKPRRVVLRFLVSPLGLVGDERVEAVEVARNELVEQDGRTVARPDRRDGADRGGARASKRRLPGRRRCPGVPFDERSGHDPERRGAACGAPLAPTSPGGSSAGRAASSARTRRTPPRPSSTCSRTRAPVCSAHGSGEATRSRRSWTSAASTTSSTTAGARSTRWSGAQASRSAARGSSCTPGSGCSRPGRRKITP